MLYANIGFKFALGANPDGAVLLASKLASHTLERRSLSKYPHLCKELLFDPQLYLAELDPFENPNPCTYLVSYPWFCAECPPFDSSEITQANWRRETREDVTTLWPREVPTAEADIARAVDACLSMQVGLGCSCLILPAPLTSDVNSSYSDEMRWLDSCLRHIEENDLRIQHMWTIALSDIATRSAISPDFLEMIADQVSARGVERIYLVIDQASASDSSRHIYDTRTLSNILDFIHLISSDCNISVGVNFVGAFGICCLAAGASFWTTNWYKSLYRLRLADRIGEGRAYPTYWSRPAAVDIHLENEFDRLVTNRALLGRLEDRTDASELLLRAAHRGVSSNDVDDWQYVPGKVSAAMNHFVQSCHKLTCDYYASSDRVQFVLDWLNNAHGISRDIASRLGGERNTNIDHVAAWRSVFDSFVSRRLGES